MKYCTTLTRLNLHVLEAAMKTDMKEVFGKVGEAVNYHILVLVLVMVEPQPSFIPRGRAPRLYFGA